MGETPGSWGDMSGRERVRAVVETMEGPLSVIEISDQAEVSRATADNELERMESEGRVRQVMVAEKTGYEINPVWLMLDEIRQLIEEHTQDELSARLADIKEEREQLENEFGVDSLTRFREKLVDEDLSSEELRERRHIASRWESLDTELNLVQHAIRLQQDIGHTSR